MRQYGSTDADAADADEESERRTSGARGESSMRCTMAYGSLVPLASLAATSVARTTVNTNCIAKRKRLQARSPCLALRCAHDLVMEAMVVVRV